MFELLNISSIGIEYGSLLLLAMLIILLLTGMPLAFVTIAVAGFFTIFWIGPNAASLIASRMYGFTTSYVFVSIPMFILMASILDKSGIAKDLFNAMKIISGKVRGGVAVQTLFLSVFLAAMSGIIGGETILLGLLALPQMLRLGYDKKLAIGTITAGGALGTMIPPSIVLIIYGLTANVSISELFTASFVPGIMLASFYIIYILIRCYINPSLAPLNDNPDDEISSKEQTKIIKGVILPGIVAISVLGSIYMGIASVSESSAIGVLGITLSTYIRKELSWDLLKKAAIQTLETSGMIIWIGIGASLLVGIYDLMGGVDFINKLILSFGNGAPIYVILLMMAILFFLGMFLDWVGVALLTMPIFVPIIVQLGYDPIWFGVLFAMNMQVSFLSPPFGPAAFYLKSVTPPDITINEIFVAAFPFILIQVLALSLLIIFPQIALWWQ